MDDEGHTQEPTPLDVLASSPEGQGDWLETQAAQALAEVKPATAGDPAANGHAEVPATAAEEMAARIICGDDILNIPAPDPLIAGWLNRDSLATLYGPPGAAKSLIALDMAFCVANGLAWCGTPACEPGNVLYVIAEGIRGTSPRVHAWLAHHQRDSVGDRAFWLPGAVNLMDRSGTLAEVAATLEPALVVVDTLNRCMAGGDENSSKDMGAVIATLDQIRRATHGACVLALHHSGWTGDHERGHSSLLGAMDTSLYLAKQADGLRKLTNRKQKDGPEGDIKHFELRPYVADDGAWDSVVPVLTDPAEQRDEDVRRDIIDVLAANKAPMSKNAIQKATGIGRPKLLATVDDLVDEGRVEPAPTGGFRLAPTELEF